jgi:hypothetical protein
MLRPHWQIFADNFVFLTLGAADQVCNDTARQTHIWQYENDAEDMLAGCGLTTDRMTNVSWSVEN